MTVTTNTSGHVMSKWAQKIKAMFIMQIVEKIQPKIETGINVSDFAETSESPHVGVNKNITLNKSNVYADVRGKRRIDKLVNDAIKHLNEDSGSSVKSIKCFLVSKYPNINEYLLDKQIGRYYIKYSIVTHNKQSFKLKKKHGNKLKKEVNKKELKQNMMKTTQEMMDGNKAGNNARTSNSNKANEKADNIKDEKKSVKCSSPKPDKDKSPMKPKVDKLPKKGGEERKPAGGKPTKISVKKTKPKGKAHKVINMSLWSYPPHPKTRKNSMAMPAVNKMKIRNLQQPMERARQYRSVRYD